jgi:uncharacterized protein (DUF983 family)
MSDAIGPYEGLEPTAPPTGSGPSAREPGPLRAVARGLRRRCPRCGGRGLFVRRFTIRDACPGCGLRLQREEGGFLGAMTINYIVTALVWIVVLVAWLVVDLPEVHVAALTVTSLAIAGLIPLWFFPYAKTTWAAVDYLVYRSTPEYRRSPAERAKGNGGRY